MILRQKEQHHLYDICANCYNMAKKLPKKVIFAHNFGFSPFTGKMD